ncbi:glycoside hydrolase family 16 protein [Chitinophaga rhizosphaerae]|uniref:glycoside hydrolase family 16 protein n=1 Tax=Chitinophaga rhizosphaerae TaxID=1864947 RepID=UPI000F805C30|nr:glycoside hydrolase family 16 protein [Chitinophaga rhizosphaerae]
MKTIHFLPVMLIGLQMLACGGKNNDPAPPPFSPPAPVDKDWQFEATSVWADEFDYNGLPDPAKWTYDLGGGGWGNNELQYYTDKPANAQVANGMLSVIARKEKMDNRDYTSARLVSKGRGDFLYGRFEIRAKLPAGKGTWPAIWMLPTDWAYGDWPKSGEIDIMEHVGYDPNRVHMSVHTEAYNHAIGTQKTATTTVDKAIGEFHVYRVDWTPYAIRGYIDGSLLFTFTNESKGYKTWPFDKKFHFLLNIAVGGNWGGQQGIDDAVFPATMEIDYVRAYKMIDK